MKKPYQYILTADTEYMEHNIEQRINKITSQQDISAEKIETEIKKFPDTDNITLLKDSIILLRKNNLLTKENLTLISNKISFKHIYFIHGIIRKLDAVNLLDQENLESSLKCSINKLFFNILILHENHRLTSETFKMLKNDNNNDMLSACFNELIMPTQSTKILTHNTTASLTRNLVSECGNTFYNVGVNPFTLRLPDEIKNNIEANYHPTFTNNLLLSNVFLYFFRKLFSNPGVHQAENSGRFQTAIYEKLERIEKRLNEALEKFGDKNEKNYKNFDSMNTSSTFFTLHNQDNTSFSDPALTQINTSMNH